MLLFAAMSERIFQSKILLFFYGFLCLFALFFLLRGELSLWHSSGATILPFLYWRRILLGAVLLLIAICLLKRESPGPVPIGFALAGMAATFFTDWLDNPYSLLRGPSIRGEIILGTALSFVVLSRGRTWIVKLFALLSMVALFATFLSATKGELIFSDDHPVFLQRLLLLKDNFPSIPFYNPLWNGGIDQRDFFATGALNVFLLLSPLVYLLDLSTYYTHLVGVLLFFIVPAVIGLGVYRYNRSSLQTAIGIVLAIGNSLIWYRWALKYGTLGFICATSLIPLVLVLGTQLLDRTAPWRLTHAALLVTAITLMLLWSPTGLVFIPLGIFAITRLRTLFSQRSRALTVLGVLAVNIPWILLFLSVSRVTTYVSQETISARRVAYSTPMHSSEEVTPHGISAGIKTIQRVVRDWAAPENPLILFFVLPALFNIKRPYRLTITATIIWAATLGTAGTILLPQLELDRMLLVAGLIAVIPISEVLEGLMLRFVLLSPLRKGLAALSFGFLFATPFSVASILLNRTVEHYQLAQPIVKNLSEAIRTYGGDGRVLFSGFILHELSGGHIAPLAFWSQHQLAASSHVQDKWRYTNVIPDDFAKKGDQGIEEYSDLMNITAVVAHESGWVKYYQDRPAQYTQKWNQDHFYIFERKTTPSFFLKGSGTIESYSTNEVIVKVATPEVVLKYNYFNFLVSSSCTLAPHPVSETIAFIALTNCPLNSPIHITAGAPWKRLFPEAQ